jgi:hypothetical protein
MKFVGIGGILIGVLCGLWMFVMGFTGWYKEPGLASLFMLVILIEVAVLVWALRQTARAGKRYWGQVISGTSMAIIGGLILIPLSLLFTSVVFPTYFDDIAAMQEQILFDQGKTEEEIAAAMELSSLTQTPMVQAVFGCIGTFVTGLIASLIIAAFVRRKD